MDDLMLFLTAALSALAALASLVGLFSLIRRRRAARAPLQIGDEGGPLPYRRVEALLAPSERALYAALRPVAVAQGADVFAKVHLADVLQVRKGAANYDAHRARIDACCIDFLLCDRERLAPLLALKIDSSRGRANGQDGDFVERALADVGLLLVHVPAKATYDPDAIAALVRDEITRASDVAQAAEPPEPFAEEELVPQPASARGRRGWQALAPASTWLDVELALPDEEQAGEGDAAGPDRGEEAAPVEEMLDDGAEMPAPAVEPGGEAEAAAEAPADAAGPDRGEEAAPVEEMLDDGAEMAAPAVELGADAEAPAEMPADAAGDADAAPAEEPAPSAPDSGGLRCPACGHALVEMQDLESGVIVLACSRYPECPHVQAR